MVTRHFRKNERRLRSALGAASLAAFVALAPSPARAVTGHIAKRPFRIVIDPGHGGSDHGAIYRAPGSRRSVAEKTVTLALARQAAKQLRAQGYSVILTRDSDRDVGLPARTALANKLGADVFMSIHMNSDVQGGGAAEGIETYILNNATDATSRRLAQLENSVLEPEETGSPEQNDVALILKDLRLDANLSESKRLACAIQSQLSSAEPLKRGAPRKGNRNRGVKQALFYVLLGADMPSVLVEAGFLNNARDRAVVLSPEGQKAISLSIARAIDQYRQGRESAVAAITLNKCKVN
jgi:N-acetylmuramoyl-L-alanine amidase